MSFRIESAAQRSTSFVTPGESFLILASSATLRKHLSDSYWCEAMQQVCSGQLEGVALRYTGENLVMLQFLPPSISPAGYRYPIFMSIPVEFMVPTSESAVTAPNNSDLHGSFGAATTSSAHSNSSSTEGKSPTTAMMMPRLCVVCGRYNVPAMLLRSHGWKCKECKGKKSDPRLRQEMDKLKGRLRSR